MKNNKKFALGSVVALALSVGILAPNAADAAATDAGRDEAREKEKENGTYVEPKEQPEEEVTITLNIILPNGNVQTATFNGTHAKATTDAYAYADSLKAQNGEYTVELANGGNTINAKFAGIVKEEKPEEEVTITLNIKLPNGKEQTAKFKGTHAKATFDAYAYADKLKADNGEYTADLEDGGNTINVSFAGKEEEEEVPEEVTITLNLKFADGSEQTATFKGTHAKATLEAYKYADKLKADNGEYTADLEDGGNTINVRFAGKDEPKEDEKAKVLEAAKEAAIAELKEAGITSDFLLDGIRKAKTIEGVESLKAELLKSYADSKESRELLEAKQKAYKELKEAGITSDFLLDGIRKAKTIEGVEALKDELLKAHKDDQKPEDPKDDGKKEDDKKDDDKKEEVVENNEVGFLTEENAIAAAKKALENDPVNKTYEITKAPNGRYFYVLKPETVEGDVEVPEEKEETPDYAEFDPKADEKSFDFDKGFKTKEEAIKQAEALIKNSKINKGYNISMEQMEDTISNYHHLQKKLKVLKENQSKRKLTKKKKRKLIKKQLRNMTMLKQVLLDLQEL